MPRWTLSVYKLAAGSVVVLCFNIVGLVLHLRGAASSRRHPPHPPRQSRPSGGGASTWRGTNSPFIYCYSSYLDERAHLYVKQVTVLVVTGRTFYPNVTCTLHYAGSPRPAPQTPSQAVGVTEWLHWRGLGSFNIACPCMNASSADPPVAVSLLYGDSGRLCTVPVRRAERALRLRELGLCVSPIYVLPRCARCARNTNIKEEILPWIEMQRLLGVDGITMYLQSGYGSFADILRYYVQTGFMEIVYQSAIPGHQGVLPNANAINDCLYRNMFKYKKLMVIDLDELIVPRADVTLVALIKELAASENVTYAGAQFWFANTLFYRDFPEFDAGETLAMFRHRHHAEPEPLPRSSKAVVDPRDCNVMTAHMCLWTVTGKHGPVVRVDASRARLHHYKACATNAHRPANFSSCEEEFGSLRRDDVMRRYRRRLAQRVLAARHYVQALKYD